MAKEKVCLALGGGAARGFAHIGVLKVLTEAQIPIDLIAGTSIGSVVGAFFASGMKAKMMEKLASRLERRTWFDFTFPPRLGLSSGEKLEQLIFLLTRQAKFEDLRIPFAVVATDLLQGERVVLNQGSVARAVRASSAIPGFFCPVEYQGRLLVDGGVLEKVPVKTAKEMGADIIIAVNLGIYREKYQNNIHHFFDVIVQSIDIMTKEIVNSCLNLADIVIEPLLENIAPSQFNRAAEAIKEGEDAAHRALPYIQAKLNERRKGHCAGL